MGAKETTTASKSERATSSQWRQSLVVISILGLAALFFALNYLIYIPLQQRMYNDKVFRILHEESEDFKTMVKGYGDFFALTGDTTNTEKSAPLPPPFDSIKEFKYRFLSSFTGFKPDTTPQINYVLRPDSIVLQMIPGSVQQTNQFLKLKDTTIAISAMFESIQNMHANLFERLMLVKEDSAKRNRYDTILYKSPGLAVANQINSDSLLGYKGSLQFATIKNFTIEGTSYKLFVMPFELGHQNILLIGFISDRNYKINATAYTFPTLLIIASLLILIMISMPLVKIFLLSRRERITVTDVRALIVVMVIAPFVFLLAIATLWLYNFSGRHFDNLLNDLHQKVKTNFNNEIASALAQLRSYDSIGYDPGSGAAVKKYESLKSNDNYATQHYLDSIQLLQANAADFKDLFLHPTVYKNLDDIFWVNKKGEQIAKWFSLDKKVTYLDLSPRAYFQNVRDGNMFVLPGTRDTFCLEPTISWSTGEYTVNVVARSRQIFQKSASVKDTAIMIGMATSLYSVCDPVVPKGFNFCIINSDGDVLFHSETYRSLHENLFRESNQNYQLRQAVANKDSQFLTVRLYDRYRKMLVTPMQGTPFYLVTYYAERERNLFVFHISAFVLLCTGMVLFLLLLFLLLYKLGKSVKFSELHFSNYESSLMRPSKLKPPLYKQIFGFEVLLFSFLLLLFVLVKLGGKGDLFLLQLSVLLPFFTTCGYYIIKHHYQHEWKYKTVDQWPWRILVPYALVMLVFFIFRNMVFDTENRGFGWYDVLVLFILLAVPFLALFSRRILPSVRPIFEKKQEEKKRKGKFLKEKFIAWASNYLHQYSVIIMSSILLIAVVPTIGFLTYAFNQEVQMQVKSRQFYTATKVEQRRADINAWLKTTKLGHPPLLFEKEDSAYITQWKLSDSYGIYPDGGNTLSVINNDPPKTINALKKDSTKELLNNHSHFYQLVTQFLFLPKDHTDFFNNNPPYYYWCSASDSASLAYYSNSDPVTKNALQIKTRLPSTAAFSIALKEYGVLLIIFAILILIVHYRFIVPLSQRIFLVDLFKDPDRDYSELDKIYRWASLSGADQSFLGTPPITQKMIDEKERTCISNNKFTEWTPEEEQCVLRLQILLKKSYDEIWESCSPEEKFILYDLALDGFSNYKNADILFELFRKGLIKKDEEEQFEIMTHSFRNYLLGKTETGEIGRLKQRVRKSSLWSNLKSVLLVSFFAVILFLFVTQQEVSNKIVAVVTGFVTLIPALLKLFDRSLWERSADKEG